MTEIKIKVEEIQLYGATNATILGYLRANRKCTVSQIARVFQTYENTARNRLEKLEKAGLIQRHFNQLETGGRPAMSEVDVLC